MKNRFIYWVLSKKYFDDTRRMVERFWFDADVLASLITEDNLLGWRYGRDRFNEEKLSAMIRIAVADHISRKAKKVLKRD